MCHVAWSLPCCTTASWWVLYSATLYRTHCTVYSCSIEVNLCCLAPVAMCHAALGYVMQKPSAYVMHERHHTSPCSIMNAGQRWHSWEQGPGRTLSLVMLNNQHLNQFEQVFMLNNQHLNQFGQVFMLNKLHLNLFGQEIMLVLWEIGNAPQHTSCEGHGRVQWAVAPPLSFL